MLQVYSNKNSTNLYWDLTNVHTLGIGVINDDIFAIIILVPSIIEIRRNFKVYSRISYLEREGNGRIVILGIQMDLFVCTKRQSSSSSSAYWCPLLDLGSSCL